jgi:hypothetical protein
MWLFMKQEIMLENNILLWNLNKDVEKHEIILEILVKR